MVNYINVYDDSGKKILFFKNIKNVYSYILSLPNIPLDNTSYGIPYISSDEMFLNRSNVFTHAHRCCVKNKLNLLLFNDIKGITIVNI